MKPQDYNSIHQPTWCPGCGNYSIWNELKNSLAELNIPPHRILIIYGIGCSGNMYNNLGTYGWHSLHGRAVPTAIGAKLANPKLTVIVVAGDGDGLGEGMGHFIHGIRTDIDITYLIHENKLFGLTTGQTSPTSEKGFVSKTTPGGSTDTPVDAVTLAVSSGASFVGRGYSGKPLLLRQLIINAIKHRGFSVVDILQPCVTFNKLNTYEYYNKVVYDVTQKGYKADNINKALELSHVKGNKIPIGIIYQENNRLDKINSQQPSLSASIGAVKKRSIRHLMKEFQ